MVLQGEMAEGDKGTKKIFVLKTRLELLSK
jgi:hypothetical protein